MITAQVSYLGDLRTKCTHVKSNTVIYTDAPTDNNGKGKAFSPTDLVATAYASCMLTIIGIYCNSNSISFNHGEVSVIKQMESNPRKISKLTVELDLSNNNWNEKTQLKVKRAGNTCPVALTLDGNIKTEIKYIF